MEKYLDLLRWSLVHRWKTVGLGALAMLATVGVFSQLSFSFFPDVDSDYSQVRIEMVPGTTLAQTRGITERVQEMLGSETGVVDAAFADINPGNANIYLTLKRDRTMSSLDFEEKWGKELGKIPDARVNFQAQNQGGPPGSGRDIDITLAGDDPKVLIQTANTLVEQMRTLPELTSPRVNGDLQRPEILITPRLDVAATMGVTTAALSQTIRIATIGDIDQNSPKFSLSDRQVPIRVTLSEDSRRSLSTIENLPVPTANGMSVPLKTVAEIGFGSGPTSIRRTNLNRRIIVGTDLAEGIVSGVANTKINALPIMKNLPQGITRLSTGQSKMQRELVENFLIAVVSGVLMVFAVLLLLYRRVMPPFVNMGSLLLAPLGAGLALWIVGMPVSMPVMIGMLMLLGIVAKNSILVVDFALEEIDRGVPIYEAVMEAGHKRAQPIVMTTVAMIAGMLPTALALTGDGAWRQPMGVVVIGGLIVSTVLTLVIVPASFSLAMGVEERVGTWMRYWLTNHGEEPMDRPPSPLPNWLRRLIRRNRPSIEPAE
jgi:multidrug efflux pump subunit AcrB